MVKMFGAFASIPSTESLKAYFSATNCNTWKRIIRHHFGDNK